MVALGGLAGAKGLGDGGLGGGLAIMLAPVCPSDTLRRGIDSIPRFSTSFTCFGFGLGFGRGGVFSARRSASSRRRDASLSS